MKVLIVYYSMYGHVHRLADAIAEGVREVSGAEAILRRVPETLPETVLAAMGAIEAQKGLQPFHLPFALMSMAPDRLLF